MSDIILVSTSDDAAAETQRKKDLAVTLKFEKGNTEKYSLKAKPPRTSALVLESQKSILNNLSIREVVVGLNHAADLMFVAYNALAKRSLQATVSGLQKSLLDATLEATVTMKTFKDKSGAVLDDAFSAYGWLLKNKESLAIRQLQRCGATALQMAEESEKLAARFQKIVDASQVAAEAAINEKVNDQNAKKKLQEKLNLIKSLQAKTVELQKNISKDLEAAQKEYEEAREREKTEGERAFITGILSATVGALATGVGSIAQAAIAIKSPIGLPGGYVPPTQPGAGGSQPTTQAPSPQAQQQKESLSKQLQEKEAAKSVIYNEKTENEAKIAKAEGIIKDPQTPAQAKADAEKLKAECEAKRADIDRRLKAAEEAVKIVLSGLGDVSKQLAQISGQSYSAAETASKQKMAYYEHRNQLAAENREALANLAQYAVELKYTTDESSSIETAIKSLEFAIQALQGVVAALSQTTLFWRNMANYCKNTLASPNFVEDLDFIQSCFTVAERQDYYSSEEFISKAVTNVAQWVALNNVCDTYLITVQEVYGKVNKNHGNPPTDDQAAAQVAGLAQAVLKSAQNEAAAIDTEIQSLRLQMQTITVPAQRVA
ncbi:MAG: hypothetical protein VKL59_02345 [Nostocaceae cyanobacterium]|nr:hypothetical protein [Nostocaceae cyanobacterium]